MSTLVYMLLIVLMPVLAVSWGAWCRRKKLGEGYFWFGAIILFLIHVGANTIIVFFFWKT